MSTSFRRLLLALSVGAAGMALTACCRPDTIKTDRLPDGVVGQAYSASLESNCSCGEWSVSGNLPPGLTFVRDGSLTGTPEAAGRFTITVDARACRGIGNINTVAASRSYVILVTGS